MDTQKRFENATCGRGFFRKRKKKTSVFRNIRIRVDRQKRFENVTCGRGFFSKTGEKKPSILKNVRIRVDGAIISVVNTSRTSAELIIMN